MPWSQPSKPVPPKPAPKPIPPPPPVKPRGPRQWFAWVGITDLLAHPTICWSDLGVTPIVTLGNDLWRASSDLYALCAQVRAAVSAGPVHIAGRCYSMDGADANLWATGRWPDIIARRQALSAACSAHDITGFWQDLEWDPWGTIGGKPAMRYPGANAQDAWYRQCWQSSPPVSNAHGVEYAAALRSAKPDLYLGSYGPWTGMTAATWVNPPHPPPGLLPFLRGYYASGGPNGITWEDMMVQTRFGGSMGTIVDKDLPGVPNIGGANWSWTRASDAKWAKGALTVQLKPPSVGACFFAQYHEWFHDLDRADYCAKIAAVLGGL